MQIEIDFAVYKAITLRRETEETTPNDVLRSVFGLPAADSQPAGKVVANSSSGGVMAAGRFLPDGTLLKTVYKGQPYFAEIIDGKIVSKGGKSFRSLSAAAFSITSTNVNGLRFWKAKRPTDPDWSTVATIAPSAL